MVLYDPADQEKIDDLGKNRFPYSRLITRPVMYKGKRYISVQSTDLDYLAAIFEMNEVNKEVKFL